MQAQTPAPTPQPFPSNWGFAGAQTPQYQSPFAQQTAAQFPTTPSGNAGMTFGEQLKPDNEQIEKNTKKKKGIPFGGIMPTASDLAVAGIEFYNKRAADYEAHRKQAWLDKQSTIENTAPKTYGSRGDYDINSGAFRPDQQTPSFKMGGSKNCYKKGGVYDVDQKELMSLLSQGVEFDFVED
jgi:hypothetical protein